MTPKEKAIDLVEDMHNAPEMGYNEHAKQCALIAVDEMILIVEGYEMALRPDQRSYQLEYYQEVKQEIEKL